MKLKKETREMDLDIQSKPLTTEDEKTISDFIKKSKLKKEPCKKISYSIVRTRIQKSKLAPRI